MHQVNSSADWRVLCELASKERDPAKLLELVRRLNQALDETFRRQHLSEGRVSESSL
jgi:hypothetical protein